MSEEKNIYKELAEALEYEMIEFIEKNWEESGVAETGMSRSEANVFLGHSTKGMSREEIDEEVSSIQLAYYTEGEADLEEVCKKYLEIKEAIEE